MGIDILGRDWDFRCSTTFWEECLSLAEAFGWERAGTVAPATCHQGDCHDNWNGNYRANDYQQVTDDDARAFAAGLKRAIDAVMKEASLNVAQTRTIKIFRIEVGYFDFPSRSTETIRVKRVAELAALASKGGFVIA